MLCDGALPGGWEVVNVHTFRLDPSRGAGRMGGMKAAAEWFLIVALGAFIVWALVVPPG